MSQNIRDKMQLLLFSYYYHLNIFTKEIVCEVQKPVLQSILPSVWCWSLTCTLFAMTLLSVWAAYGCSANNRRSQRWCQTVMQAASLNVWHLRYCWQTPCTDMLPGCHICMCCRCAARAAEAKRVPPTYKHVLRLSPLPVFACITSETL